MRKILLASLAAVFTLGLMSSCSKDDDGPGPDLTDYAANIAGIFKGDMTVALGEAQPGAPTTEKIYVTRTGENKVTMEIKNFTYEGMSLGNIEIKDVAVAATKATDASAAYKCAVTGKGSVSINLNGVPLTADVEVSGTVANDKADIKIVVDAAGLKVNVGFAGDKIGADTPDYALDIAGTYTGKMIVTVGDTPVGPTKQEIVFARQNENVVQMSMEDFSFGGASLGKIVLSDVNVAKKDAGYTVAGEGDVKVSLGGNPLTVKVTLEGTVEDKATELVMTINVPGVGDVKAEFTGAIEYVPSDLAELLSIEFADNAKVAVQPATTDGKNYTFAMTADATADDLKGLVPTIVVSEMATVVPASNKTVDFSQGAVDFVVTAEDGTTTATYTVSCVGKQTSLASFEEWEEEKLWGSPVGMRPVLSSGWATSNSAAVVLQDAPYKPVGPVDAGYKGKGAQIYSIDARTYYEALPTMVPALAAGSLFIGEFKLNMTNTLASTRFGALCDTKPTFVSGYYKYAPGDSMINNIGEALKDAGTDECSIVAVLYEVENEEDETLDGSNVLNDSRIVASAIMTSGEQKDFKQFGLELNYTGEYNPANKYKFALVCSSSKNGSGYKGPEGTVLGARGSMLIVDEISVRLFVVRLSERFGELPQVVLLRYGSRDA